MVNKTQSFNASDTYRPYEGVRILDMTRYLGSYATRLFADLGAEVIRIEPEGGSCDRPTEREKSQKELAVQSRFIFHNANKKSVYIDLNTESGRTNFLDLAEDADIIAYEESHDVPEILDIFPALGVSHVCARFSYFGLGSSNERQDGCDLIAQAAGGLAWLTGRPENTPLRVAGEQASFVPSVYGAVAMSIALWDQQKNNGHGHIIDISAQESFAHSLQNAVQVWDLEKRTSRRGGEGTRDAAEDVFSCDDGYVFLASPPTVGRTWSSLIGWIGENNPADASILRADKWSDLRWRTTQEAKDIFRELFERFIQGWTRENLTVEAISRNILLSPVNTIEDVFSDAQLNYREFFTEVVEENGTMKFPGAPYKLSAPVWHIDHPAPIPGQHTNEYLGKGNCSTPQLDEREMK